MKTTVIIPNFNGKTFLYNCLISLQKCVPQDFDILVVDNGSTDGSVEMMNESFPKIRLILLNSNTGFAHAVNEGVKAAVTPYAILLNNDTTVATDFVEKLEKAIEEDKHTFSVSAKMVSMQQPQLLDGAGDLYCALGWAFALGKGKDVRTHYTRKGSVFSACGGAAIYRIDMMKEIGYFDENHFAYLEDVDVGYRARIYGYENKYCPDAVCLHAGSGFSGSRYNEFKIRLASRNSVYLIYKNMPLLQIILNLPFLAVGFLVKIAFFIKKGFGRIYCEGLIEGIKLSVSEKGRKKRVIFHMANLTNYLKIQLLLWWNLLRRVTG